MAKDARPGPIWCYCHPSIAKGRCRSWHCRLRQWQALLINERYKEADKLAAEPGFKEYLGPMYAERVKQYDRRAQRST